jgi:pyruvate formate lyase activating enzyme
MIDLVSLPGPHAAAPPARGGPLLQDAPAVDGSTGYVHAFHMGSVVDGPGVRFVLWTTGCLMRCQYCHNPETWRLKHGRLVTLEEVMGEIGKYTRFLKATRGGVTISGGEPLVQAPFVRRVLHACKAQGLHTALDTNGYLGDRLSDDDLDQTDLVLLDLKSFAPLTHRRVTGRAVEPVLAFARRLSDLGKPAWIRFVLVPGLTDDPVNVEGLAAFAATLRNVARVEVRPFHQMGRATWDRLSLTYRLADTPPPTPEQAERVTERFRAHGLPVP